ncbi:hypothetical protein A1O7_07467 [Cladophialophora yegresii CBS 114405]|uniref:C2H2-type domain-containing protein n=1 Tax=Cladophialophora yegresii CBS 114405 TaxID=1182544 RepID=W9VNL1_9EURO|nr:uncharacterized protein A1O7_07467 [Cladophialophora yegresii CBS 114405]EXJ57123.1 hypothetical protein A1O7_07467 [Cladophialophora yegresii CBS 114405]
MADDSEGSSDIEFSDEETQNPRIGRKAIESILEKSAVDRIESKKKLEKLRDVASAPSTAIHREYWLVLFEQYAQSTLHINRRQNATPTGDDLIRFLFQLPSHLESRHEDGKIAWTVIKGARAHLERALFFKYEDFKLSKRDELRLDATIQQLLNDGEITKSPVQAALWLSCQMVKRMVTAVFTDAMLNGTKSWDVTLAGCLGLVLQAALAARAGDFTRSSHYGGAEYLKWQDIELVATGSSVKDPGLRMLITLQYRKAHKNDPRNALQLEFGLLDEEHNTVDVVKLLVAYALRIGRVAETAWEELISVVLRRRSKRFVWSRPDDPVFFGHTKGERLDFANAAPVGQQTRFLRHAASLIGMMARPVSHDLRRGAASDIFSLKQSTNVEGVRRSLGHSQQAKSNGTTDRYIGRVKGDSWAARIEVSAIAAEDPFEVPLAPTPFVKRKVATKDIDKYCTTHKLDVNDRNSRHKARKALEKVQYDRWLAQQQSVMNDSSTLSEMDAVVDSDNGSHVPAYIDGPPIDSALVRAPLMDITNIPRPLPATKAQDDANTANEGIEESSVQTMTNILGLDNAGHSSDPSVEAVDSMSNGYVSLLASCPPPQQSSILTSSISDFIGFLSTINLVSTASPNLPHDAETGGSRLAPSKFLFACRKEGCLRAFDSKLRREQHEVNCEGVLSDGLGDEEPLSIGEEHQQTVPKSRNRKRADINMVHDGFPKPCPDSNICGVTKDFATMHLLKNHRNLHHDAQWPKEQACNVLGCQLPGDHYFVSREAFRRHLSTFHMFDNTQALEYIGKIINVMFRAPRGTSASYMTTMCLFPGCKTVAEFANYSDYTSHLKKTHKQTPDQYPKYMPTAATVRLHPRPDLATIDVSSPVAREFQAGPCNYPLCSNFDTTYTAEPALVRHLNVSHGVEKSEAPKHFGGPEIAPFYGTRCLHPDCGAKNKFYPDKDKYVSHLKTFHALNTVAEISSFQLWHKLKYGTVGVANE